MIAICIPTWPNSPERLEYFDRTCQTLRERLTATGHELVYFASSEAQDVPRDLAQELVRLCQKYRVKLTIRHQPANLGANMNAALRLGLDAHPQYVFMCQDDWLITEPLDLAPYCRLLDETENVVAMVRFCWSAHPEHSQPIGPQVFTVDDITCRQFQHDKSFRYGDQPQLRRAQFPREYGWFVEGGNMGRPEFEMQGVLRDRHLITVGSPTKYFEHLGTVSTVADHYAVSGL
jgi:hypothetical protein